MASTNFKLFDENKANMMSDTEYNINTQRLNGVQAGIASSKLQNKTLHQTSLVAYSLAQIMIQNGYDANDSVAVSAFAGNMSNSLLQKVLDKATSVEAKNGVNNTKWMTPELTKSAIDTLAAKSSKILSNATKTLYGLKSSDVPNDVLIKLSKSVIVQETKITDVLGNLISIPGGQIKDYAVFGTYTGDGTATQTISLGFTPKILYTCSQGGVAGYSSGSYYCYGGLAAPEHPVVKDGSSTPAVEIISGGFRVNQPDDYNRVNVPNGVYHYIAFR